MRAMALLVFAVMLAAAPARAVTLVVAEVRGIDLRPGQSIDGAKPLILKEGQQVTLISTTGRVIKLRGPFDQAPAGEEAGSSADMGAALRTLVTQKLARNEQGGVVRGNAAEVVPPEPWLVDVTHAGNRCLPEEAPLVFWRPDGAAAASLVVTPTDRSWLARADWVAGSDRLTIPRTLPVASRSTYVVKLAAKENAITLITIPAVVDSVVMRAAWMSEAGCDAQALALLRSVRETAQGPGQ